MEREPVVRQAVYSDKSYPGCMEGVPHLFDLNQALNGKKLLMIDRKRDNGLTASRNSSGDSKSVAETLQSNTTARDQTLLDSESCKCSKYSAGMSIKTLIAQELSKEPECRNQTPNLVARLMGLDALPVEQKNGVKVLKASAAEPTKCCQREKQSRETKSPQFKSQKNAASLVSRASQQSRGLKSYQQLDSDWEVQDGKLQTEVTTFHSHPLELQKRETSREFVERQSRELSAHTRQSQFKGTEMEPASQQRLSSEKLNKAKLANNSEGYCGSVDNGSEDKFSEFKEFLDAVEFLQSNKDMLLKLLKEPNSLFAQHLQDLQSYLQILSQTTVLTKQKKGHKLPNLDEVAPKKEGRKLGLSPTDFLDPLSYKSENKFLEKMSRDLISEKKSTIEDSLGQLLDNEFSPNLFKNQDRHFVAARTNDKTRNADSQVPTRIVVLKPSPRRTKNHKYLHSCYSTAAFKESRGGSCDDAENPLHELRERIKAEGKACSGEYKKPTMPNINSHFRDGLRNPKDIAREIARQIRESVTRDMLFDSDRSNTFHSIAFETKEKNPCDRYCNELDKIAVSIDGEASTTLRRLFRDLRSTSSSNVILPGKYVKHPDVLETYGSKGGRKRGSGRSKLIPTEVAVGKQLQNHLLESPQVSIHAKSSYYPVSHDKDSLEGFRRQQILPCIGGAMESNAGDDLDGLIDNPFLRSREEFMDNLPTMLSKSKSVPVSRSFESIELKRRAEDIPEIFVEKEIVSSVKVNKVKANAAKGSTFISNASGPSDFTIEDQRAKNKVHIASLKSSSDLIESTKGISNTVDRFEVIDRCVVPVTNSSVRNYHMSDGNFNVDEVHSVNKVCDTATHNWKLNSYKVATATVEYEDNAHQYSQTAAIREDSNIQDTIEDSADNSPLGPETVYHLPNEIPGSDLEAKKEKLEQPSPVSVLDSPFQEEITSPESFKEVRSNLRDLWLWLHLLKSENCERSQIDLEAMSNEHASISEESRTKESDSCSQTVSEAESICGYRFTFDDLEHVDIESIGLNEEAYSTGRDSEMLYLGTVLIASGFSGNSASILARWHAPNQPLGPYLFQKINDYCHKHSLEIEGKAEAASLEKRCVAQILLSIPNRRLLFECLNEILVDILGKHLNWHPWVMPSNLCNCSMPTGKDLMKLISKEVSQLLYLHSISQETLDNLVIKDLSRSNLWMELIDDTERVAMELEKAILKDLIDDIVISIVKK